MNKHKKKRTFSITARIDPASLASILQYYMDSGRIFENRNRLLATLIDDYAAALEKAGKVVRVQNEEDAISLFSQVFSDLSSSITRELAGILSEEDMPGEGINQSLVDLAKAQLEKGLE